jgi:hypothetical protein
MANLDREPQTILPSSPSVDRRLRAAGGAGQSEERSTENRSERGNADLNRAGHSPTLLASTNSRADYAILTKDSTTEVVPGDAMFMCRLGRGLSILTIAVGCSKHATAAGPKPRRNIACACDALDGVTSAAAVETRVRCRIV